MGIPSTADLMPTFLPEVAVYKRDLQEGSAGLHWHLLPFVRHLENKICVELGFLFTPGLKQEHLSMTKEQI